MSQKCVFYNFCLALVCEIDTMWHIAFRLREMVLALNQEWPRRYLDIPALSSQHDLTQGVKSPMAYYMKLTGS